MTDATEPQYLLSELVTTAASALETAGIHSTDGRTSSKLDGRTVRYYTTEGLVDPPQRSGRRVLYGSRHLAQILAIKHLQAQGLRLSEIQTRLTGADDQALTAIRTTAGDGRFWARQTTTPTPASLRAVSTHTARRLWEVDLGSGLRLVGTGNPPTNATAIQQAAQPLVALIQPTSTTSPTPTHTHTPTTHGDTP